MRRGRRGRAWICVLAVLALPGVSACSVLYDPPPVVTPAPVVKPAAPVGPADLEAARAAWAAQAIDDYRWTVAFGCECLLNGQVQVTVVDGRPLEAVSNGQPVDVTSIEGFPLTIDEVFDEAAATLEGGGSVTATWGAGGLPTQLSLDRVPEAVDDELGISILSVTPGP